MQDTTLAQQEQTAILEQEIVQALAKGARLESRTTTAAVVVYNNNPTKYVMHAILTLLTFGLWLMLLLMVMLLARASRVMITVDECGNIARQAIRS